MGTKVPPKNYPHLFPPASPAHGTGCYTGSAEPARMQPKGPKKTAAMDQVPPCSEEKRPHVQTLPRNGLLLCFPWVQLRVQELQYMMGVCMLRYGMLNHPVCRAGTGFCGQEGVVLPAVHRPVSPARQEMPGFSARALQGMGMCLMCHSHVI